MSGTPIEEVFDALKRGDEPALQEFFPRLRERLFHLAKQRLGGDRAEEVVQETLATLWERRDSIEDAGHLLPFLFQVLRNKIGNAYMRAQKERDRKGDQDKLERLQANPPVVDPAILTEAGELQQIVAKAIKTCVEENEKQGKVLLLLHEGRTASEIGVELGNIPISTVRTLIHRGRKRLKEILKNDFQLDL
ncbi:RNA polymerase sigma factor [Acidobacteriota bacterium]